MKNYKIFLDDVRNPYCIFKLTIIEIFEKNEDWVIVRDYYQFINAINKFGLPKYISFDHDLSFDHYLGENQEGDIDYDIMNEEEIYMKWKKILRGISLEDAIRCEGFNEDFKDGILSSKELEEEIYQISIKYS